MTPSHRKSFNDLFSFIFKDNKMAISLAFILIDFSQVWDDIKDKDYQKLNAETVDNTFVAVLTELAGNPLWDGALQGCFLSVYFRWQAANFIESNLVADDNELSKAWMLRAGMYDLFVMIARKLYGNEWAVTIAPTVYLRYGETLAEYLKEVRNA